jgi:hypothetical protein
MLTSGRARDPIRQGWFAVQVGRRMSFSKTSFRSVMGWWQGRQRQQIPVFSAIKLPDASAPLHEPPSRGVEGDRIDSIMREATGDKSFEYAQGLLKQREGFKAGLANAIDSGLSGREMAEFLNGHAFLWKYLYDNAERDPQFMAIIERALTLCANYVPEHWHQAVKDVDENREHHAALRREYLD